jgi:hypothetical protein
MYEHGIPINSDTTLDLTQDTADTFSHCLFGFPLGEFFLLLDGWGGGEGQLSS